MNPLRGSSQSDEDNSQEEKEQDDDNIDNTDDKSMTLSQKWQVTSEQLDKLWQALQEKLPQPLVNFVKAVVDKIFALRWQFVSFAAGAVLTVAAIIVPIYSQVETLSKPVTLFETILGDLEQAYVDPVDTDKLFETGMAAMLRYVLYIYIWYLLCASRIGTPPEPKQCTELMRFFFHSLSLSLSLASTL